MKDNQMRFRSIKIFIAAVLLLALTELKAQNVPDFPPAVTSFLTGIESLDGQFSMEMANGIYTKQIERGRMFLEIEQGTLAGTTISMDQGKIKVLRYRFSKPLVFSDASLENSQGLAVSEIILQQKEVKISYELLDKKASYRAAAKKIVALLKRKFNLTQSIEQALKGDVFGYGELARWAVCTNDYRPIVPHLERAIVERISISNDFTQQLVIGLKPKWQFIFHESNQFQSYLITRGQNNLRVTSLETTPSDGWIQLVCQGQLGSLEEAVLQSPGIDLKLRLPIFSDLLLKLDSRSLKGPVMELTGGLVAEIVENSSLSMVNAGDTSTFRVASGSKADIKEFSFENSPVGTRIRLGLNTDLRLNLKESMLVLNERSYVKIKSGIIQQTSLTAEFFSDRPENKWLGTLFGLRFEVDGGKIGLNEASRLGIKSASIAADRLNLDNAFHPQLTGTFSSFSVQLDTEGVFSGAKDQFVLRLEEGSYLKQDEVDPLRLARDEPYPLGNINIHFGFSELSFNKLAQLTLHKGRLDAEYKYIGKGQFVAKNMAISGGMKFLVEERSLLAEVTIAGGKLELSENFAPDFIGVATFEFMPFEKYVIKTPCMDDDQLDWGFGISDEHIYPVNIEFSVPEPIVFSNMTIRLKRGALQTFTGQTDTEVNIGVPTGYGEYDEDHDDCWEIAGNTNNKKRGPEEIRNLQEAIRLDVGLCTIHFWLKNTVYKLGAGMKFEYIVQKGSPVPLLVIRPSINLKDLNPEYIQHGCDDTFNATLINIFIDQKKKIKEMIQEKLNEYSERFSQSLYFPLAQK